MISTLDIQPKRTQVLVSLIVRIPSPVNLQCGHDKFMCLTSASIP
jgi:hypothetical protein